MRYTERDSAACVLGPRGYLHDLLRFLEPLWNSGQLSSRRYSISFITAQHTQLAASFIVLYFTLSSMNGITLAPRCLLAGGDL